MKKKTKVWMERACPGAIAHFDEPEWVEYKEENTKFWRSNQATYLTPWMLTKLGIRPPKKNELLECEIELKEVCTWEPIRRKDGTRS